MVEYCLLALLAAAAFAAMFGYLRSALSHQMKSGSDGIGHGLQYR